MSSKKLFCGILVIIFQLAANSFLYSQTEENEEIIKVDVALVNIPVIVSDRLGRSILGLSVENFTLEEDGKSKKIEYLSTTDTPLNIVLLVDTSRSAQDIINKIRNAAGKFVQQLQQKDRCMIISFAEKVQVESEFTSKRAKLENAVKGLQMSDKPGTLMLDAIFATVDKELSRASGRKAIILLTDGKDVGSATTKNNLIYRLVESDAPIYSIFYETINVLPPVQPQTNYNRQKSDKNTNTTQKVKLDKKNEARQKQKNLEAAELLQKISDTTAGRVFPKEIDNLDEAFKNVADELRKQYLISYYPDDANFDISRHQIKIKVNRSDVVVRTKNTKLSERRNTRN